MQQVRRRCDNGEPTRAVLPHTCRTVGAALARERLVREWSLDEVASRLFLSKRQVLALEQPDPGAFYNVAFLMKALRRYMDLVGLPHELLEEPDPDPPPVLRLLLAEERLPPRRQSLPAATLLGVALLTLSVGAGTTTWWRLSMMGRASDVVLAPAPLPSRPLELLSIAPSPVTAQPAVVDGTSRDDWRAELPALEVARP
jgi:hypothetical protein